MGAIIGIIIALIPLVIGLAVLVGVWKTFAKAGKPGWAFIIPIYGNIVMLDIIGQPWTRLLWYLIPLYGLYLAIVDLNAFSRSYGKGSGFTVGLIFLGPIFWCILGFGSAQYLGPNGEGGLATEPEPGPEPGSSEPEQV